MSDDKQNQKPPTTTSGDPKIGGDRAKGKWFYKGNQKKFTGAESVEETSHSRSWQTHSRVSDLSQVMLVRLWSV